MLKQHPSSTMLPEQIRPAQSFGDPNHGNIQDIVTDLLSLSPLLHFYYRSLLTPKPSPPDPHVASLEGPIQTSPETWTGSILLTQRLHDHSSHHKNFRPSLPRTSRQPVGSSLATSRNLRRSDTPIPDGFPLHLRRWHSQTCSREKTGRQSVVVVDSAGFQKTGEIRFWG